MMIREHAFDEPPAAPGVREPPLVFDRQSREARAQRPREETRTLNVVGGLCGLSFTIVMNQHIIQPTARRTRFEHVAAQSFRRELLEAAIDEPLHRLGDVAPRVEGHEPYRVAGAAHQIDRLARGAEARFDLRTHRHPVDVAAEHVDEPRVALVAAVVAYALAEQARRDADARFLVFALHR